MMVSFGLRVSPRALATSFDSELTRLSRAIGMVSLTIFDESRQMLEPVHFEVKSDFVFAVNSSRPTYRGHSEFLAAALARQSLVD